MVTRNPDIFSRISGRGLMRGLHLHETHDQRSMLANFQWNSGMRSYTMAFWMLKEQQVLTMPCFSKPSCLRIQPPLNITKTQINQAVAAFDALAELLRAPGADVVLLGPGRSNKLVEPNKTASPLQRVHIPGRRSAKKSRKFQFSVHPLHEYSFLTCLPVRTDAYGASARESYLDNSHKFMCMFKGFSATFLEIPEFQLGDTLIEGTLFGINFTAEQMLGLPLPKRQHLQNLMAESAETFGADVMGLGAFTSIIASPRFRRLKSGAVVTPGSSLTAFASVEAALSDPPLTTSATFGVLGANGSVGGLCVQMLILAAFSGKAVDRIMLLLNPENPDAKDNLDKLLRRWIKSWSCMEPPRNADPVGWQGLKAVAEVFNKECNCVAASAVTDLFSEAIAKVLGRSLIEICFSDDPASLNQIDRLLIATNAVSSLDELRACRHGVQIYDIGMPSSVPRDLADLISLNVHTAGLVQLPGDWEFGHGNIVGLPPGISLGCFAETITLAATDPQVAPTGPFIGLNEAYHIGMLAQSAGLHPTLCNLSDHSYAPSSI